MIHFRSSSIKSLSQEMKCTIRLLDDFGDLLPHPGAGARGVDYAPGMGLRGPLRVGVRVEARNPPGGLLESQISLPPL